MRKLVLMSFGSIKFSELARWSSPPNVCIGGPSPNIPPGFPLKACGNDGLREGEKFTQQAAGIQPA